MPFDTKEAGTSFVDWLSGVPFARTTLGSPLLTALVLTALAAVVALTTFKAARSVGARAAFRAALYFCGAAALVLFTHHRLVVRSAGADALDQSARTVHAGVELGVGGHPHRVEVAPRTAAAYSGGAPPECAGQPRFYRPDNLALVDEPGLSAQPSGWVFQGQPPALAAGALVGSGAVPGAA